MQRRLLLDIIICERATILELLAGKNEALLIRRNTLFILNLLLHVIDRIRRLHIQRYCFTRQSLYEDLHYIYRSEAIFRYRVVPS